VTVTIGNVTPGRQYSVQLCVDDRGSFACVPVVGSPLLTDGNGSASVSVTLTRKVDVGLGPVDCGRGDTWCYLEVSGPDYVYSFDLQFVGAEQPTTPTSIEVVPPPSAPPTSTPTTQLPQDDRMPTETTVKATTTTQGTSGGTAPD
jgi:hypothetical protein